MEIRCKQFDVGANFGGVENGLAIRRPDRCVAAAAVEVGDVEEFRDASISVAVGYLFQFSSVSEDDMRMAVVVVFVQSPSAIIGSPANKLTSKPSGTLNVAFLNSGPETVDFFRLR